LFFGCAGAKNRRKQGPFWWRNPFNVLLKIALPDVDHIITVFGLLRARKAANDEEPKNKRREYTSPSLWKASVLVAVVINATQYYFAFCDLVGSEIGMSGERFLQCSTP